MQNAVISVKNLVKKFGNFTANDHLSFEVYQGEIFGFLGANGAGKTTALRILSGLSTPTSGEVVVAGFNAARDPEQIKRNIGYMSQKFSLYEDLTSRENIMLYGGIYGLKKAQIRKRTTELLSKLRFEEYAERLIADLPLGLRQKLAFSVALLHEPKIVFLDEPTGGVDPVTRRQFWELIYEAAEQGVTVFVTTHYMDEAEYCDRVCIMSEGKIVALDTPANLKKEYQAQSVEEVFVKIARPADQSASPAGPTSSAEIETPRRKADEESDSVEDFFIVLFTYPVSPKARRNALTGICNPGNVHPGVSAGKNVNR